MSFQWLKNRLGIDRSVADLSTLVIQSTEAIQEHLQEQKKGVRRLALAQKQQGDTLDTLKMQVEVLGTHLGYSEGTVLQNEHILELLDNLHRIELAGQHVEMVATLVQQTVAGVLQHSCWEALAYTGHPYPEDGCEVIGAIPSAEQMPGTVREVIQQGYRDANHQLIRTAKVVVYQQPQADEG